MEFILLSNWRCNENDTHPSQYFFKLILQIVASNIWKDMEEKEKIPYAQGKLLNDAVRKNYSIMTSKHVFQIPDVFFLFVLIWCYHSLYWNPGYHWPYRWNRNSIWMEYTILYCWTHQEQIIVYLKVLGSYGSKNPILNLDLKWYD